MAIALDVDATCQNSHRTLGPADRRAAIAAILARGLARLREARLTPPKNSQKSSPNGLDPSPAARLSVFDG